MDQSHALRRAKSGTVGHWQLRCRPSTTRGACSAKLLILQALLLLVAGVLTRVSADPIVQYVWHTGHWSRCAFTCGNYGQPGVSRSVDCRATATNTKVTDSHCQDEKPINIKVCEDQVNCPVRLHKTDKWGQCNACVQKRIFECRYTSFQGSDRETQIENCTRAGLQYPEEKRKCPDAQCATEWIKVDSRGCSVTCGSGTKQVSYLCVQGNGNVRMPTDPELCEFDSAMPAISSESCIQPDCPTTGPATTSSTASSTMANSTMSTITMANSPRASSTAADLPLDMNPTTVSSETEHKMFAATRTATATTTNPKLKTTTPEEALEGTATAATKPTTTSAETLMGLTAVRGASLPPPKKGKSNQANRQSFPISTLLLFALLTCLIS